MLLGHLVTWTLWNKTGSKRNQGIVSVDSGGGMGFYRVGDDHAMAVTIGYDPRFTVEVLYGGAYFDVDYSNAYRFPFLGCEGR